MFFLSAFRIDKKRRENLCIETRNASERTLWTKGWGSKFGTTQCRTTERCVI